MSPTIKWTANKVLPFSSLVGINNAFIIKATPITNINDNCHYYCHINKLKSYRTYLIIIIRFISCGIFKADILSSVYEPGYHLITIGHACDVLLYLRSGFMLKCTLCSKCFLCYTCAITTVITVLLFCY